MSLTFSLPIQSSSSFLAPVIFLVLRTSPLQPVIASSSHAELVLALQQNFWNLAKRTQHPLQFEFCEIGPQRDRSNDSKCPGAHMGPEKIKENKCCDIESHETAACVPNIFSAYLKYELFFSSGHFAYFENIPSAAGHCK